MQIENKLHGITVADVLSVTVVFSVGPSVGLGDFLGSRFKTLDLGQLDFHMA